MHIIQMQVFWVIYNDSAADMISITGDTARNGAWVEDDLNHVHAFVVGG